MEADPILFRDLTYVFLAAVLGGLLAWRLKLPLILGFVVGGAVISPFTPGPQLSDLHTFEVFAEVGVVLLMFSIGVEFSIPDLMRVKWVALGGGSLGILMSIALALIASWLAGWSTTQGIVVGVTISVASTMVMARLLADRGALGTTYGRVMIGITLVEDLAVVFMTVVLPVFNAPAEGRLQKIAWTLGKAVLLLVPLARRRRRAYAFLHSRGSRAKIRHGRRRNFHCDSRRVIDFDFPECVYRARCAEMGGAEATRWRTRYGCTLKRIARLKINLAPPPHP
jgi:monovalent cation:H+ antiporter-2, CPA2 family